MRSRLAVGLLAVAVMASAAAVDPFSLDAFVSPKWLLVELAVVVALAALVWQGADVPWRAWSPAALLVGVAAVSLLAALVAAALAAGDVAAALPTLRRAAALGAMSLLGASTVMGDALRRWLLPLALGCLLLNGLLSLAQWMGLQPLPLAQPGGRFPTGALLGNEGLLALSAALLLPVLAVMLGVAWRRRARTPAGGWGGIAATVGMILLATLLILLNRQLTAAIAALSGVAVVALLARGRQHLARAALWGALLLFVLILLPPTRLLLAPVLPQADAVQALTTQRLGAWAAADGMWRDSPWLGHGPGSYALESQAYRLAAEQRLGVRLLPPVTATGFAEAHNDYLQLAAEAGLPALLAALLALGLLLDRLFRRAVEDVEARAVAGMLVAGAVAALAWFPLQVPLLALLLMLGLGRAWRLIAEPAR